MSSGELLVSMVNVASGARTYSMWTRSPTSGSAKKTQLGSNWLVAPTVVPLVNALVISRMASVSTGQSASPHRRPRCS